MTDKILYYENLDEEYSVVMGKRKREPTEVVTLNKGENLIIYDGLYSIKDLPMFNSKIKNQIEDYLDNVQVYDQRKGTWQTLINQDHPLYFEQEVDGTLQLMPFILNIKVTDTCTFVINR